MTKKICFVGPDNYPVLNPEYGGAYFGGESVQQTLLARAFVRAGYEVSMVTADFGQPDGDQIDGVRVWKMMRHGAGLPVLRFVHPRITSIYRALRKANADIYYQSCAGMLTGSVAFYCRLHQKRFIFRLAHDSDCIPGKQIIEKHRWRDEPIYNYGLRHADLIAAQSDIQMKLLQTNYGLNSVIVNMAVQPPDEMKPQDRDIDLLWVNNLRPFKRPDLVLELARMMPEKKVVMIGGSVRSHEVMFETIRDDASGVSNLEFLGAVPYHKVNEYFSRSKVFINTSESEGFPNSFLQAWIRGVPVFSFFDPDGLVDKENLGGVPGNIEEMADRVRVLLSDPGELDAISTRAQKFAETYYAPASVAAMYIQNIEEMTQ